jgi:hypothetical protein
MVVGRGAEATDGHHALRCTQAFLQRAHSRGRKLPRWRRTKQRHALFHRLDRCEERTGHPLTSGDGRSLLCPPPEAFAAYNNVLTGAADRILRMAENQATHRRGLVRFAVRGDYLKAIMRTMLGYIAFAGAMAGAEFLLMVNLSRTSAHSLSRLVPRSGPKSMLTSSDQCHRRTIKSPMRSYSQRKILLGERSPQAPCKLSDRVSVPALGDFEHRCQVRCGRVHSGAPDCHLPGILEIAEARRIVALRPCFLVGNPLRQKDCSCIEIGEGRLGDLRLAALLRGFGPKFTPRWSECPHRFLPHAVADCRMRHIQMAMLRRRTHLACMNCTGTIFL